MDTTEEALVDLPPNFFLLSLFSDLQYNEAERDNRKLGFPSSCFGWLLSGWSFSLILFTLVGASHGLGFLGSKVLGDHLDWGELMALILIIMFFVYVEGYVGFHKSWSPVTARRCLLIGSLLKIRSEPIKTIFAVVFGPIIACGFFWAPKRRLIISYFLVVAIILLVLIVRRMSSPWHEIVDCGVAFGLGTGTLSFLYHYVRAIVKKELPEDVDYIYSIRATQSTSNDVTTGLLE